jgi:hypothetical protein
MNIVVSHYYFNQEKNLGTFSPSPKKNSPFSDSITEQFPWRSPFVDLIDIPMEDRKEYIWQRKNK